MSRPKKKRKDVGQTAQDAIRSILGPMDGAKIPGGCDQCDAYQMTSPISDGAWSIRVFHDDWCPFLKGLEER